MTAYGGNLTVFHRFLFSGASVEDSEVILKGGGLELHYGLGAGPFMSGREQKSKFTLKVCKIISVELIVKQKYEYLHRKNLHLHNSFVQGKGLVCPQLWDSSPGHQDAIYDRPLQR